MKILTASYVLTMNTQNECIKNGAILIEGDQIKAVGTLAQLTQAIQRCSLKITHKRS